MSLIRFGKRAPESRPESSYLRIGKRGGMADAARYGKRTPAPASYVRYEIKTIYIFLI
jgi:hypothetical protein